MEPARSGPLTDAVVLDLTRYGPGPYCAMILGDMGADVITVDEARAQSSPVRGRPMIGPDGVLGARGSWMRRNARRIALDLKHPDGLGVARRIAARADVLLESFRPGVAARLGLGAEDLRRDHPSLIVCSISGFGQDGPYRDRPGHDLNYIALGGLLDGNRGAGGAPVMPMTVVADLVAGGMQAAIGVLAAMLSRQRTGDGQVVDVSLHEGIVALMAPMLDRLAGDGRRAWTLLTRDAPWYNVYQAADGDWIAVAAVEPWFYATVCELLGHPEWSERQFDTAAWSDDRAAMAAVFGSRPLAEWRALLETGETCVTAVPTLDGVLGDDHLRARGTFVDVPAGAGDTSLHVRPLPRLSGTPLSIRRGPVGYGADTDAILAEIGCEVHERERLYASGAVARGEPPFAVAGERGPDPWL